MNSIAVLQKSYILVPLCLIISLIVTFLLNLLITKQDEQNIYIKTSFTTIIVATLIVFIHNMEFVSEQIITDLPPF